MLPQPSQATIISQCNFSIEGLFDDMFLDLMAALSLSFYPWAGV